MVCLGFGPGVAGWKERTNPLSYGGTPIFVEIFRLQMSEADSDDDYDET